MMNNLARVRARESAEDWLADRKLALPVPPRVGAAYVETAMVDAFVAGWGQATAPETEAEVNAIIASLIRDAQAAGGDDAAEDAALRVAAYLGAIHREEQDQWAEERQIGQRQLDDATALMRETAELLRGYEKHHRDEAFRLGCGTDEHRDRTAKADRNALAAARLEAWLRGDDRYPVSLARELEIMDARQNPAEVLRGMAEGLAAQAGLGVDHPAFDDAAAKLAAPTIYRLGESVDLVDAMTGAALIEQGAGWVKVHGVRNAEALFNVLRLAKIAGECGEPDEENPEADVAWFAGARWRKEGVADLAAFRLTTGDPRFDPAKPVSVNGFTYHPATKED